MNIGGCNPASGTVARTAPRVRRVQKHGGDTLQSTWPGREDATRRDANGPGPRKYDYSRLIDECHVAPCTRRMSEHGRDASMETAWNQARIRPWAAYRYDRLAGRAGCTKKRSQ